MEKPLNLSRRELIVIRYCLNIVADNSLRLAEELEPLLSKNPNLDQLDLEQEIRTLASRVRQEGVGFKIGDEYFLPDMTTLTAPDEYGVIKHLDHEYNEIGQRTPADENYQEWEDLFSET